MCEHGVNVEQMNLTIAMVNDTLALAQQHLEQLHHLADHAENAEASAELAQVTVMLGEAREKLDAAVEGFSGTDMGDVTVELV
jgi:hypothetical protein